MSDALSHGMNAAVPPDAGNESCTDQVQDAASRGSATLGGSRLVVTYALFAAVSILANLGSQKLSTTVYHGFLAIPLSVVVGTGVGLVVKFLLDKLWIFDYEHRDIAHGVLSFLLYSLMGVATTVIFWGFEFGADHLFGTDFARLTGGFIGLVIGYVVKYQLDKKFVFR